MKIKEELLFWKCDHVQPNLRNTHNQFVREKALQGIVLEKKKKEVTSNGEVCFTGWAHDFSGFLLSCFSLCIYFFKGFRDLLSKPVTRVGGVLLLVPLDLRIGLNQGKRRPQINKSWQHFCLQKTVKHICLGKLRQLMSRVIQWTQSYENVRAGRQWFLLAGLK